MVRSVDLFDIHDDSKVFYDSLFCCDFWKSDHRSANDRNRFRFSRFVSRTTDWKKETQINKFEKKELTNLLKRCEQKEVSLSQFSCSSFLIGIN